MDFERRTQKKNIKKKDKKEKIHEELLGIKYWPLLSDTAGSNEGLGDTSG